MRCVAAGVNADECNVQEQGEGWLNQVQADALLLFLSEIHTHTPHTLYIYERNQSAYPSWSINERVVRPLLLLENTVCIDEIVLVGVRDTSCSLCVGFEYK